MRILDQLNNKWKNLEFPFLVHPKKNIRFSEIFNKEIINLDELNSGDVVAIIGDFDPVSISTLLQLMDKKVIIVPLTNDTKTQHKYFFETAQVDVVIENNLLKRLNNNNKKKHKLIEDLKNKEHGGLVLFSTGSTGPQKAILHDLNLFIDKFKTPRPPLKTMSFLLFDHIGGLNTLLHTLFNSGVVVVPQSRNVNDVLTACKKYQVEALPTTPTFLRLLLMSNLIPQQIPKSLKIITYGTERMDQPTLDALCDLLPNVDFRQTFGMSELGIFRVKSEARDSLFMKIGGEGVETRVVNDVLEIKSNNRMLGYLNAENPFDENGWYNTKDIIEEKNGYYKIIGRTNEVINVGGLKFMASELEKVVLQYKGVEFAKAEAKQNPITGQHVELMFQPKKNFMIDISDLNFFLGKRLPKHMMPMRIKKTNFKIGHRFKKI